MVGLDGRLEIVRRCLDFAGLAEFSAFALRETTLSGAQLENLRRELLEKSLTV
jgi:hypothetical protein